MSSQNFARRYRIIEGITPAGVKYAGHVTFVAKGAFYHGMADLGAMGVRYSIAMPVGDRFVIAWGPQDKMEIGAYTRNGENMLGLWVPPAAAGDLSICGNEPSTRITENDWKITHAIAIDQSTYAGKLTLEPQAETVPTPLDMTWTLEDGTFKSFGLRFPDAIISTYNLGPDEPYGIIVYDIQGPELHGIAMDKGSMQTGTEKLIID